MCRQFYNAFIVVFMAECKMDNQETAKMAAKSKMELSAAVLAMLVLFGAAAEFERKEAPLDEATVIYVRNRTADALPLAAAEPAAMPVAQKPASESVPERAGGVSAAEKPVSESVPERAGGVSAAEFLGYLHEVHTRAEAVAKPESALEKIILPVPEPQPVAETAAFNEQVIEITDDNGEVVEIVEVRTDGGEAAVADAVSVSEDVAAADEAAGGSAEAIPVEESISGETAGEPEISVVADSAEDEGKNAESATENAPAGEPVVLADENPLDDSVDGEAVDMMKEILEREQAAAAEK